MSTTNTLNLGLNLGWGGLCSAERPLDRANKVTQDLRWVEYPKLILKIEYDLFDIFLI